MNNPSGHHHLENTRSYTAHKLPGPSPQQAGGYLNIILAVFLLSAVIGVVLICSLFYIVTQPVHAIRTRLTAISGGDFSRDDSIEWDNEFGDIGKAVNQLAVNIHNLIDAKIAYEKQKFPKGQAPLSPLLACS